MCGFKKIFQGGPMDNCVFREGCGVHSLFLVISFWEFNKFEFFRGVQPHPLPNPRTRPVLIMQCSSLTFCCGQAVLRISEAQYVRLPVSSFFSSTALSSVCDSQFNKSCSLYQIKYKI